MATRTKSKEVIDAEALFTETSTQFPATTGAPLQTETVEYDDVTALNNVLAELGADEAGGFVVVHREMIMPSGKREDEYLDRFPVADFSLDNLKARWGSGKYKINVYHSGGNGLAARKTITIAKDPTQAVPVASQPAAQPATDLTPILQTMQAGFEKMIGVLAASQQKQPSRMEWLQEMAMMKEMFGGAAPAQPPMNPVELLKLGVEMASKGATGLEDNNSWVNKMIDQFGPLLTPVIGGLVEKAASGQAPATVPRPVAPTLAAPAPAPMQPAPQSTEEENPVNIIILQYLKMLSNAAKVNAPVDEYADSILATVPASQVIDLENLLKPDDWREKIRAHTLVIEQYPVWFTGLRDTILQFIEEDRQQSEVSTNLTPMENAVSVPPHENADTGIGPENAGDAGGIA